MITALPAVPAQAGPPYVTDDPQPTEPGHWEIFTFAAAEGAHHGWDGELGIDLNYGAAQDLQLSASFALKHSHEGASSPARTRSGAGDIDLGVKYRFLHQEKNGIDMSVFPHLVLPTARRQFGTGRVRAFIPVWAQKDLGQWSVFGGGGYTINPGAGNRDFWQGGFAVNRAVGDRLSLGGEIVIEGADEAGARSTAGIDFGATYKVGGPFALLFSGGPARVHRGPAFWRAYAALGLGF
jgi:hypothetical protein